jgi:hypothetical protein
MASAVPLVPIEARLTGEAAATAQVKEGVPGGAVVRAHEVKATVRTVAVRPEVDLSKRKVDEKVIVRTTEVLGIRVVKP